MRLSADRILTTHVGSLPRSQSVFEMLVQEDRNELADRNKLRQEITDSVALAVRDQVAAGIDIVNDGELGKSSYTHYVKHRLSGISSASDGTNAKPLYVPRDMSDHPDLMAAAAQGRGTARNLLAPLVCDGKVNYTDKAPVERDIANLKNAAADGAADLFMTSAAPGTLAHFIRNGHYQSEDSFLADLADAMRVEYEAIWRAGIVLQIDCPDLAMSRHITYQSLPDRDFLRIVARNVEALNHATRNIPPDAMRMHICWGNYPGPHTHDVAIGVIGAEILRARPQAILFEAANPRHDHEWEDWKTLRVPDDKVLVPGAIDSTTNIVEHPRRVCHVIRRYADIVGRDRVLASTDCGFGTVAGRDVVAPSVVYAKLRALAEGARLASQSLWQ